MKNKTKTYILLALVLSIWGAIGFKIVEAVNPSEANTTAQNFDVSFSPQINSEIDTFSIETVNRDPFLGTLTTKRKIVNTVPKPKTIVWKPIIYHGNISKNDAKKNIFIVSIDGKQYLMKLGQTISDIKLVRGDTKKIVVVYKGHRKSILKS